MRSASRFSAIIFDCDGVLVDSEVVALEVEIAALAGVGLHFERSEYSARFLGMSNVAFHAAVEEECRTRTGRALPADFRERCRSGYLAAAHRMTEVPGARAAIAPLKLPRAVASSSTDAALSKKLRNAGLWDLFAPHIYSADHVARAKPAPDLFLHAARALAVEPAHCLVIEDSQNGVAAAQAAGMTAWGFLGGGHHHENAGAALIAAGAERLVSDWPEAATLFARLS